MSQQQVTFSVQNQKFTFPRQVLLDCKNSFFETLLHENFPIDKDEEGNILLDRETSVFQYVAEYLIDHKALEKYKPFSEPFLNELLVEADFLPLDELKQYITKCLRIVQLPTNQQLSYKDSTTNRRATGIMVDLEPLECDIALDYFDIISETQFKPDVYYKEQSMIHDSLAPAAWQLLSCSFLQRPSQRMRLLFQPPVILKESQIYAFHITFPDDGLLHYEVAATQVASNETLQLFNGRAVYFKPFAQEGEDHVMFIGIIGYSLCK